MPDIIQTDNNILSVFATTENPTILTVDEVIASVTAEISETVVIETPENVSLIQSDISKTNILTIGIQGPPGPPGSGGISRAAFILDIHQLDEGIVSDKVFDQNSTLISARTDGENIRVIVGLEGGSEKYIPSASLNDQQIDNISESSTKRWFIGELNVSLNVGNNILILASDEGGRHTATIERVGAGPAIASISFGDYPGGQSELKENDLIPIEIHTDQDAVEVTIIQYGASKTERHLPVVNGIAAASLTVGGSNGLQRVKAFAKNSFGTPGEIYESSDLLLNQQKPIVGNTIVSYPSGAFAFNLYDFGQITQTASQFDSIEYTSNLFSILNQSQYEETKTIQLSVSEDFQQNVQNIRISAFKESNGSTTIKDIAVTIACKSPTAAITIEGNPSRLVSSPSGIDYKVKLQADQSIIRVINLSSSIGMFQGTAWLFESGYFVRNLRITDSMPRGFGLFSSLEIEGLSRIVGSEITSGFTFEVGGFTLRTLTVPAFSRIVEIGTNVRNQAKVSVQVSGGNVLTRYEDSVSRKNGFYISDASGAYSPTGNFIAISDIDFAGANTSGTLKLLVQESP